MNGIRGLGRAAAVVILALLALLAPSAATAHDQLIESFPADGDVITEMPLQLSLEFSDQIIPMMPAVLIQDAARNTVHEAAPALNGRVATSPFPELPDGAYNLNWSVVSADGHRIEGSIPFEMATGIAPAVSSSATAEPGDGTELDPAPSGGMQALPLWVKITLMLAATASVATVILLRLRRKPPFRPNGDDQS